MFAGVGLFGTFFAFLASWSIGGMEESQKSEIEGLRQEVRQLIARSAAIVHRKRPAAEARCSLLSLGKRLATP